MVFKLILVLPPNNVYSPLAMNLMAVGEVHMSWSCSTCRTEPSAVTAGRSQTGLGRHTKAEVCCSVEAEANMKEHAHERSKALPTEVESEKTVTAPTWFNNCGALPQAARQIAEI